MSDDLREALSAAFDGDTGGSVDAGGAQAAAPVVGQEAGAQPAAAEGEASQGDGRARDPATGKFVEKSKDEIKGESGQQAASTTLGQPAAVGAEASAKEPIRPPASWSPEAKAAFPALPPAIQAEIAKREQDIGKGLEERASQLKRHEPLDAVLAPHDQRLAIAGVDRATYVRSLVAADEALRNPATRTQALAHIAQTYGIDLRQAFQPSGQQQPGQAQLHPQLQAALQPLLQEVSTLKTTLAQQSSAQEQALRDQNQKAITDFSADPKNVYFENVRSDMAALIRSGQAANLQDAYDKAIWARPDIRPLLLQTQQQQSQASAQEAARAKAEGARRAAGSVTGSPSPGASPAAGQSNKSLREELEAAFVAAA